MKGKRYRGQVVLWDDNRMFGFIQSTEMLPFGGEKIFVHRLNCIDDLHLGAHCEFEIGDAYKINRKPQAVRVKVCVNAPGLEALAKGLPDGDHTIKDAADISSVGASCQGGA